MQLGTSFARAANDSLSGLPAAGIANAILTSLSTKSANKSCRNVSSSEGSDAENYVLVAGNWRRRADQHVQVHTCVKS